MQERLKALIQFYHDVREEMTRVSWPSRDEVVNMTLVVISMTVLFAVVYGAFDYALAIAMKTFIASLGS